MSNDVISAFSKVSKSMAQASPMKGVFFPPAGKHPSILEDIVYDVNSSTKHGGRDIPAMSVSFRYRLITDPESPQNPRAYNGKTFYLPLEDSAYDVAAGKKGSKFGMERDRFMGHLTTLLGREIPDPSQMGSEFALVLQNFAATKASGGSTTVEVDCNHRAYEFKDQKTGETVKGTDRYELLTAKLSG